MMRWRLLVRAILKSSSARTIPSPRMGGTGGIRRPRARGSARLDAELGDQPDEGLAQVRDRSLTTVTFAVGADAGAPLGASTPNAVFVLFDGVGDMHRPAHRLGLPDDPSRRSVRRRRCFVAVSL